MRFGVAFVCVAVVACGLDVPRNSDVDNDFVRDELDNCRTVANPDQSNFDHDADGDACDVCESGVSDDVEDPRRLRYMSRGRSR